MTKSTHVQAARSHARARRVAEVAEMMRSLTFRRGTTTRELAQRWHISRDEAGRITAEASRLVAAEVTDRDATTADVGVVVRALVCDSKIEPRDRVKAAEVWSRLAGTFAAERVEVAQVQPVTLSEDWAELRAVLLGALEPFPEAHAAVVDALRRYAGRT